jgi:ribosomal protein S27AE
MTFPGTLTPAQGAIVAAPFDQGQRLFVRGPAGAGKTTALQRRLIALLAAGVPSYTVLTLLAEPDTADGYRWALTEAGMGPYSDLHLVTFSGLAREMVTLFWPLIARPAGFEAPHRPPVFLSYDLAQIHMKQVIAPMLAEGVFEGLRMRPQQILSQVLDNLNRAALNGLTLDEMETRLVRTWTGAPEHTRYFYQAGDAARRFRQRCLDANLIDLSLVIELFQNHLLGHPHFQDYFTERYRHLLVDNVEEMPPAGTQFLRSLLSGRDSAVVAYDEGGGYKRYLAADPGGAATLADLCDELVEMPRSMTAGRSLEALSNLVQRRLVGPAGLTFSGAEEAILQTINPRYRREMIQEVVALITDSLLPQGTPPSEIAIVTPYLDGALRYGLTQRRAAASVPHRLLRRRGSPRDDPLVRAWLTLTMLAHPHWGISPSQYDVAEALAMAVEGLDRPRAALAARRLYDPAELRLGAADGLAEADVGRIGPQAVEQIGHLQRWLERWPGTEPLDRFLGHLFADLLSAPPFRPAGGAHRPLRQAAACDWLIRAAARFRRAAPALGLTELADQGRVFIEGIFDGIVSGTPPPEADVTSSSEDGVIISTLYAYLLTGPPVQIQIWLETGATGWWETPRQPLSNAFVLAPGWDADRPWTEADNFAVRNELLARLVRGLCARCGRGVVLASSHLDRRGERQDGPLWRALAEVVDQA